MRGKCQKKNPTFSNFRSLEDAIEPCGSMVPSPPPQKKAWVTQKNIDSLGKDLYQTLCNPISNQKLENHD
jgi:hypothetical protein